MAVRTKKYTSNGGRVVRAVKVNETNIVDIANWAGKSPNIKDASAVSYVAAGGDVSNQRVRLHTHEGIRVAKLGDYVARVVETTEDEGNNWSWVIKADIFEDKYTLVTK